MITPEIYIVNVKKSLKDTAMDLYDSPKSFNNDGLFIISFAKGYFAGRGWDNEYHMKLLCELDELFEDLSTKVQQNKPL